MTRHSFVQISKLTDVKGRIDYIGNPKRQEHLYAFYSTVEPEFWQYLSDQAQNDFWKSHQKDGRCVEARELIIALPESLRAHDPKLLLQLFTEQFREKYGVQCAAALHHNKAMTNYHIHLVFADRDVLEKTEVKKAARNMFFDESGRHVRTKREIVDEHGAIRPGCRILAKGETYDVKWFSGRKEIFKTRDFLQDAKQMYTALINSCVLGEEEKLQVFDPAGPYLPTKKIGKNNPLADVISSDNELRQEWNRTVDQVLIAGGSPDDVTEFKISEVTEKAAASIREKGDEPRLFSNILRFAVAVLKEFLDLLMRGSEPGEEIQEKTEGPTEKPVHAEVVSNAEFRKAEAEFLRMNGIHQKLNKANRKLYALQKQQRSLQDTLNVIPDNLFHRKERKAIEERIDGIQRQLDLARAQLEAIPKQHWFKDVKSAEAAYRKAKAKLEHLREQADGNTAEALIGGKTVGEKQKVSVLKQLAANRLQAQQEEASRRNKDKVHGMEIQ